jgi:hypothetical protein
MRSPRQVTSVREMTGAGWAVGCVGDDTLEIPHRSIGAVRRWPMIVEFCFHKGLPA